jgi:predicted  nucleic acid-binding Zn-ribbon protein
MHSGKQEAKVKDLEEDLKALKAERAVLVAKLERATTDGERRALQERLQDIDVEIIAMESGDDA